MSDVSRQIIEAVKAHQSEHGIEDPYIPMEGDLESEIDKIILDAVFHIKEIIQ